MKKYYMLKGWQPSRGTTEDNPAYYKGTGSYILHHPLTRVNPEYCYTSEKRAQNVAMKYNGGSLWVRYRVIEVPEDLLFDNLMTSGKLNASLRELPYPHDQIEEACNYTYMKASYDEIQSIVTREDVVAYLLRHSGMEACQ